MPICVFAIVYGTIVRVLKKKNTQLKQQLSYRQRYREHQLRKIVRMSVALIISFIVCTIPQLCFLFARIFLWNWKEPAICSFCTVIPSIATVFMMHSWSKTWSAVNPCVCLISIIRSFWTVLEKFCVYLNNIVYFFLFKRILCVSCRSPDNWSHQPVTKFEEENDDSNIFQFKFLCMKNY